MTKGQKIRLAIAIALIVCSLLTQGTVTVLIWLFAIPLLPFERRIRIPLLLGIGGVYIFIVSTQMFDLVYDTRTRPLEKISAEMGWEFDAEPPRYYYDFFYRDSHTPRPAFASSHSEYYTCSEKTNRLSGSYLSTPTMTHDCEEYYIRNSQKGGTYQINRKPEHFTSISFDISANHTIPDFAIVHTSMKDTTRIEPYRAPEDKYTITVETDPPRFMEEKIDNDFSYIRQIWDPGFNKYSTKTRLGMPQIILDAVISENTWWYLESTGKQIHLHKRTSNGGILIEPEDISQFIEDAYQIYQLVIKNPPKEI
ncbi:MAG: hypothetical protein K9M03_04745 [Kiritimatiellales bacterium]|nr:hypothetical protein [Kiritimatiellales bacterium]